MKVSKLKLTKFTFKHICVFLLSARNVEPSDAEVTPNLQLPLLVIGPTFPALIVSIVFLLFKLILFFYFFFFFSFSFFSRSFFLASFSSSSLLLFAVSIRISSKKVVFRHRFPGSIRGFCLSSRIYSKAKNTN